MDIEEMKKIQRKINLNILRKEINKKDTIIKIQNHLNNNPHLNLSLEEIQDKILKDDLIASFFIKNPSKQNISEKLIGNFLENLPIIENFRTLPNKSDFLVDGKITKMRIAGIKSIDFMWKIGNKTCIATQKYTTGAGGAQDNQFNDVISFLKESQNNNDPELIIFAIVDGDYYTPEKIRILKNISDNPKTFVCGFEEIEEICQKIKKN